MLVLCNPLPAPPPLPPHVGSHRSHWSAQKHSPGSGSHWSSPSQNAIYNGTKRTPMYLIKPNLFCWIFYSTAQCRAGAKLPEKRRRSVLKYFIFEIFLMIPRFSRACQHAFTKVIESEIMLRIPFVPASRLKILKRLFHIKPPRKVPTRVWNLRISRRNGR